MKKNKEIHKILIGSVSIISLLSIISVTFVPFSYITITENKIEIKESSIEDWDIIVPDDYNTIQAAIDHSTIGDRIFVKSGNYRATGNLFNINLNIDKKDITLHGEDKNTTIINGWGIKNVVFLTADNITIKNFKIKNNAVNGSLLTIYSKNNHISNNIFEVRNFYDGYEYGITVYNSNRNNISKNHIYNADTGLNVKASDYNIFYKNVIEYNNIGIDFSQGLIFNFSDIVGKKIFLKESNFNTIKSNIITNNRQGIYLYSSTGTKIYGNNIASNFKNGLSLYYCLDSTIKNNIFKNDGLKIRGNQKDHYLQNIKENWVNGKKLYYIVGETDVKVPSDAGQVFIVDCMTVEICNTIFNDTAVGITVAFSNWLNIHNNKFLRNSQGIYLYYCNGVRVTNNNFIDNSIHASFISKGYIWAKRNIWRNNYWEKRIGSRGKIHPKLILGLYTRDRLRIFDFAKMFYPVCNFDWSPAWYKNNV